MDERSSGTLIRWAIAAIAALVGVVLLAQVIGSLVPQVVGDSGSEREQLAVACRLAGRVDGELCRRADRAMLAADDGHCDAARAYASPVLAVDEQASPLAQRLRALLVESLEQRCPAPDEGP
ncbi:MAG: hypothetical protein EA397_16755 [Deltaproteobacteria bacterium]|nr:MAG: hypothetical protein EA397_16755 [Deltaproteobacteria bacterium]